MRGLVLLSLLAGLIAVADAQLGVPRLTVPFAAVPVFPMATRAGGAYNFQGVNVPTGVVGLQATVDLSQATDPLPTLTVILEGSLDGGSTWQPAGTFENAAGPKGKNKQGQTLTQLVPAFYGGPFWSATTNPTRQLRGVATLGGAMRFGMTVTPL